MVSAIFKTGSAGAISIALNIFTHKVMALFMGPIGYSIFTIFRQLQVTVVSFATLGSKTAIIEGIGSAATEKGKKEYRDTATLIILIAFVLAAGIVFGFSDQIERLYFTEVGTGFAQAIKLLAVAIGFNLLYFLVYSLLNAYIAIGRIATLTILLALSNAILVLPLVLLFDRSSCEVIVLYLAGVNIAGICAGIYFLKRDHSVDLEFLPFKLNIKKEHVKHFLSFSSFLAVSGFLLNFYISALQSMISTNISLASVAFFMVAWTFSPRYLNLLLDSFGTYYLPTLVKLKNKVEERNIFMGSMQKIAIVLSFPLIVMMILFCKEIVILLYSSEFVQAVSIISIMLIGDFLKVSSWTIGINLLANGDVKIFMLKEVIVTSIFFGVSYIAITYYQDIRGAGFGYIGMYIVNLLFLYIYSYFKYSLRTPRTLQLVWLVSFTLILLVSFYTFSFEPGFPARVLVLLATAVISTLYLSKEEKRQLKTLVYSKVNRNRK